MTDELDRKRKRIDALDAEISGLLAERLSIASSLAVLKKKIRDPEREALVLERAAGRIKDRALRAALLAVYRELLKQGRTLQASALAAARAASPTRGERKRERERKKRRVDIRSGR